MLGPRLYPHGHSHLQLLLLALVIALALVLLAGDSTTLSALAG